MSNSEFYPSLNKLVSLDKLPAPIKSGVDSLFSKLFYKSYYVEKNLYGDTAYHHLVLIFDKVGFNLFGGDDGFEIIFNPGSDSNTTELPISIYYNVPILKYVQKIKLEDLSTIEDYFKLILEMFNINEDDLLFEAIGAFLGSEVDPVKQFIDDFNSNPDYSTYTPLILIESSENFEQDFTIVQDLIVQFETNNLDIKGYLLENYFDLSDLTVGFENLSALFKKWLGEFSLETIMNLFIPKFSVSIDVLEIALAFPRTWLKPVDPINYEVIDDENTKAMLTYNVGSMAYSSETGFEFNKAKDFKLSPCQIGNTGIIIEVEDLVLDFKSDSNIPQADADGRSESFRGVYAETAKITLPSKWFKKENEEDVTLQIKGRQLLIGTEGGVSGTIGLEALNTNNSVGETDYMWFKIGGEKGFKLGFNKFDITLKQNKVVGSNIKGALEIPKFKDKATGVQLQIGIEGHLYEDGDFNLTASFAKGSELEANLLNVADFKFNSFELGKQDDDFYIGTACEILFTNGVMQSLMKDQKIIIEKLRIYSDGNIELVGGDIPLPVSISLNLGPVKMAVSNVHFGSTQINGRKYNYWGFDGAISINPLGLDARGEGVKYYYTVDDDASHVHNSFIHIQTIEVDLIIPGTASEASAMAIIHGMITLPEPGASQEFIGEVSLKLPKANISGGAGIKFTPKYPAFLVDANIELPVPIPLGFISISAFRGLLGFRYVATKQSIKLTEDDKWYDYYKHPKKGVNINKFTGPPDSLAFKNPFSIGAGATFGTADGGYIMSLRAMMVLSLPTLFYIDAGLSVMSKQLGLIEDDPSNPPFFAYVAIGDDALELGAGADFSIPKDGGQIIKLNALIQAGFFFKNQKPWYVNFGTRENPITAELLTLLTAKSFIMISAQGIEAGARLDFKLNQSFGPAKVRLWAYLEVGGKISFKRPQMGGYIAAGGGIYVNIWIVKVELVLDTMFSVESFKPFLIYAEIKVKGRIKVAFVKIRFDFTVQLQWDLNKTMDYRPYSPIPIGKDGDVGDNRALELVKGVHMLTNEAYSLSYFEQIPNETAIGATIPLDTYIDIKNVKGLIPQGNAATKIGGFTSAANNYTELMPPNAKTPDGRQLRQVSHQFSITNIELKIFNENDESWADYNPFEAIVKSDERTPELKKQRWAYWQKSMDQYDSIRVLATNPFSFMSAGEPGWHIPEQYGITASKLFCVSEEIDEKFVNFLNKNIGQRYFPPTQKEAENINGLFFKLIGEASESDDSNVLDGDAMTITGEMNPFGKNRSLSFQNYNQLEIIFPEPTMQVSLSLTTHAKNVEIKAYRAVVKRKEPIDEDAYEVEVDKLVSYEEVSLKEINLNGLTVNEFIDSPVSYTKEELTVERVLISADSQPLAIDKLVITPIGTHTARILEIRNEIASLFVDTYTGALDNGGEISIEEPSDIDKFNELTAELELLKSAGGDCYTNTEVIPTSTSFTHFYGYKGNANYVFESVIKYGDTTIISFHPTKQTTVIIQIDAKGKLLRERLLNGVVTSMQVLDDSLVITQALEGYQCKGIGKAIIDVDFVVGCQGTNSSTAIVALDSDLNQTFGAQYPGMYSLDYNKAFTLANNEMLWVTTISNETIINWINENDQVIYSTKISHEAVKVLQHNSTDFSLITKDKKIIPFSTVTLDHTISLATVNEIVDTNIIEILDASIINDKMVLSLKMSNNQFGLALLTTTVASVVVNATIFSTALYLSNNTLDTDKILAYNEKYIFQFDDALQLLKLVERKNPATGVIIDVETESTTNEIVMISTVGNDKGIYLSLFDNQFDNCTLNVLETPALVPTTLALSTTTTSMTLVSNTSNAVYRKGVRYSNLITVNNTICAKGMVYEEEEEINDCHTYVQQIGWLSEKSFIYNSTIPSVEAVNEEKVAMIAGVQNTVQPIWRPNAKYYLHFTLQDDVKDIGPKTYNYYYGFKTEGPIGHFTPPIKTFLAQVNTNPDKVVNELTKLNDSPLTSLRRYIDYNRSYPNADGSLLQAKPVYYGNEQCKISLFFTQPYVYHMLKKWEPYAGQNVINGALNIMIKDPLTDDLIEYPLPVKQTSYPRPIVITDENDDNNNWVDDNDPRLPLGIKTLNNFIEAINNSPSLMKCSLNIGEPLKPKSYAYSVTLTNLKPSKLYTVLVNNYFDANQDNIEDATENALVHQFGFQTSRYESFEKQVNSYVIDEKNEAGEVIGSHPAIFDVNLNLEQNQIDTLFDVIAGISNPLSDALALQYNHLFDRATAGILKMSPLEPAQNTEFNRIINTNTGEVIAILIRNPEPFNVPKMPIEEIQNTISVVYSTGDVIADPTKSLGDRNESYKVIHSKDYSQVLIIHDSKKITAEVLSFGFEYRAWNNNPVSPTGASLTKIAEPIENSVIVVKDINIKKII